MAGTAERILDSAQALAQTRGYNGFSYADISAELSISKPSIHHHYASKARLAEAVIERYRERFAAAREPFEDLGVEVRERLAGYADLYAEVFSDGGRMCLCGVFAADAASLPPAARRATAAFFADQQRWVASAFLGTGLPPARAERAAQAFLAGLEGALLLARARRGAATAEGTADASADSRRGEDVVPAVAATLLDALL
jgi:TetR/AcrR family transcriptional repressor of nem operon